MWFGMGLFRYYSGYFDVSVSSNMVFLFSHYCFCFLSQKNGNAGKITREQGSPNLLGLFYLKNNDATFQAS